MLRNTPQLLNYFKSNSGFQVLKEYFSQFGLHTRTTTVLCVRKADQVVVMSDGQVTQGSEVVKPNVKKVRKIGSGGVIGGFAGATVDALALFDLLENKLEEHQGQLIRACVELAKAWRTEKYLRRLDATLIVADKNLSLSVTGAGDVLEPHDGVLAIGSGSPYALAATRALLENTELGPDEIARKAMKIAADADIYTNHNFMMESIGLSEEKTKSTSNSQTSSSQTDLSQNVQDQDQEKQ
eukprot:TRINITY_DN4432_c0_g2_i1.p1 TRINITY_DN4432_c0_g2~~TRINITY_DN4432_c0_g2_i1.p1  ORF type:complete len:240 (+),score=43.50 TRINITY_DN4432_c0_g2_i1:17-736(+)